MKRNGAKAVRKPTRIYVVDDLPIVHTGFRYLTQKKAGMVLCGHATTPEEALTAIPRLKPDLVIAEIAIQGTRGIQLVKQIKERLPAPPVLVYSRFNEVVFAERALRAGAQGYVRKQDDLRQLLRAIHQTRQRKIYVSPVISDRVLERVAGALDHDDRKTLENLSDRELEVFRLIGKGLGTRQIARDLQISVKTIETYREHIKEKLEITSARELLQLAIRWGHIDCLS
jgi:DNA-binding NarL/FixJ family response regulator